MKLVITNTNWADEMDVWGFEIIPSIEVYTAMKEAIVIYFKHRKNIVLSVGSNEDIEITEDSLNQFIYKDITKEEADTLKKLFGTYPTGNSLHEQFIDRILYVIEGIDEEKYSQLVNIIYDN